MNRVSPLDAAMLLAESAEMPMHNLGVLVFAPGESPRQPPHEAVRAAFTARLHLVPAFRRRLVRDAFGVADLRWIEDGSFDLTRHLLRAELPAPGGMTELAGLTAAYAAETLGRDKPLWEVLVVEGLEGGAFAALAKIHHAAMDGLQLAALLGTLFEHTPDVSPRPPERDTWRPEREPGALRLAREAVRDLAAKPARALAAGGAVVSTARIGSNGKPRAVGARARLAIPETPWSGALTSGRSVAFAHVPLADVREIGARFGATVNDVVLAACTGTLRAWLRDHGALPDAPLVANVPIAVAHGVADGGGNHVSMLRVPLPMHELTAEARLGKIHAATSACKQAHRAAGANTYRRFAEFVLALTVPALVRTAVGFYARHGGAAYHPALWNVVISNVPGPRDELHCGGARLSRVYPFGPVQHGSGLNLTVMSTGSTLCLGVLACREAIADPTPLAEGFSREVAALLARARSTR